MRLCALVCILRWLMRALAGQELETGTSAATESIKRGPGERGNAATEAGREGLCAGSG